MQTIKCPKCGEQFTIDESGYAEIVKQARDKEFSKELRERQLAFEREKEDAVKLEAAKVTAEKEKELAEIREKCAKLESSIGSISEKVRAEEAEALHKKELEISELRNRIDSVAAQKDGEFRQALQEKETELAKLRGELEINNKKAELEIKNLRESHKAELQMKDDLIAQYKDFKLRQSTKMVGESLERFCYNELERIHSTAFPEAFFGKDNDSSNGSKGDFIFRESRDGVEFISIMFEMKNESDDTDHKHKNEDFFAKLDKDRKEKGCEYAVLVTMLEADNDLYNDGIVDVSHKYEKMYVIRPQFFIPMISLLRNISLKNLSYKKELIEARNQNLDITNFESKVNDFKENFSKAVIKAGKKFSTAIDEIDKTIVHLQEIKANLLDSDKYLQAANSKTEDLTIKKLTRGNPTMKAKFEELSESNPS